MATIRLHTVAILCRLAMRRGSQIPLAMLARQLSIYWANESLEIHCANAYFTYFYQQI